MHRYLLIFAMLHGSGLSAISIVYNFRIAQITKQPIFEKDHHKNHTIVTLLFDEYLKKYNGTHQKFLGGFGSFIYNSKSYYFRTDVALSSIHEVTDGITTFSGTETDDILFSAGRNFILNNRTTITFSGLCGFPTHKVFNLQHAEFGYGQIGAGMQLDGLYDLKNMNTLLYGVRYIYFSSRKALDTTGKKYTFTFGNVADILTAYKKDWKKHGLELGYTFRSNFGADVYPNFDDIIQKTNYIRSSFYAVYKYKFLLNNTANRLLFNISYGLDHEPKMYGNKYIITLWASWNISF